MPDQPLHTDLGGYLIGRLGPAERARVEQHLTTCEECRALVRELSGTAASLDRIVPAFELPAALEARTFEAVENDARNGFTPPARPAPRWWTRRPVRRAGLALAAAAIAVAAAFAGAELGDRGREGTLELQAALSAPDGGAESGTAAVTKTGIGRVIEFRSDNLPILPKGEYYELWFVGPGDTLERPNRISAGTSTRTRTDARRYGSRPRWIRRSIPRSA